MSTASPHTRERALARSPSPSSLPSPKRQKLSENSHAPAGRGVGVGNGNGLGSGSEEIIAGPGPSSTLSANKDPSHSHPQPSGASTFPSAPATAPAPVPINGTILPPSSSTHDTANGMTVPSSSSIDGLSKPDVVREEGEEEEEKEDDDEEVPEQPEAEVGEGVGVGEGRRDMFLDTVTRTNLDFDFERLCSVSLSRHNIYACLVCGKYFQGRGKGSWAYRHAVGEGHRVWLGLETEKFYVLPELYQVSDPSLNDIISVLNPTYTPTQILSLSRPTSSPHLSYTLTGTPFLPGYIGLNNIHANDYMNVILHTLLHVPPIRTFFLSPLPTLPPTQTSTGPVPSKHTELVLRFAALARRIWNPKLFKAQVSPHEFLQEVGRRSEGKFGLMKQGDPVGFLGWLVNTLHRDLGGTKKPNSSVIYKTFQGEVKIQTQEVIVDKRAARPVFDISRDIKTIKSPFLFLALDLPPAPIFQDINEKRIIPQVPLGTLLAKYDGVTTQEMGSTLKRHQLTRLPPYLILFIKRFTSNNFVAERNPTIVNFPLRGVDLKDLCEVKPTSDLSCMYDLVANIPHEANTASTGQAVPGTTKKGDKDESETKWKVHLRAGSGGGDTEKWYSLQDLEVGEVRKEMVFLGETVIQVWERRDQAPKV